MKEIAVAGVGMHPWGKWGRSFVTYGVHAARAALDDAGVAWSDVDLVVGGETVRNGYGGYVAGATFAQALGWNGANVATSYAACATGAQALDTARSRILSGQSHVALVVGADTTPKGFLAPNAGERWDDPDWLRFRLMGMTNPAYFALYARRRIDLYGATQEDFAAVKVKNSKHGLANPYARYRKETSVDEVMGSAIVADPLHLLDICATSDGGAAVVLVSDEYAAKLVLDNAVRIKAISTVTPTFPQTVLDMPYFSTESTSVIPAGEHTFKESLAFAAYEEAGVGPEDVDLAEVYDLSTALELDWIEDIGLCKRGEAEALLRAGDTSIGGRIPVNASGGLACFGEAVPAQALAQVCELTWQLRGQAEGRQVEGARIGITANQGLFGHGSSVILGAEMEQRIVVALWSPRALEGKRLLEECQASWLQLNIDDAPVADAMLRFGTFEPLITALVSLPADAHWQALADHSDRIEAWLVETESPIPPLDVPSGERLEALANVAMLRVPSDLAYEDWLHIWKHDHTPVGISTQGTFGYVQNRVLEGLTPDAPNIAAIVEEHFPMAAMTDFHAFYGSGGDDDELSRRMTTMMDSVGRFGAGTNLELVPTSRYVFRA